MYMLQFIDRMRPNRIVYIGLSTWVPTFICMFYIHVPVSVGLCILCFAVIVFSVAVTINSHVIVQ